MPTRGAKMILDNEQGVSTSLFSDEPVEFDKTPVEVQDFLRKDTDYCRRIYGICLKLVK